MKNSAVKRFFQSVGPIILVAVLGSVFVFLGRDWFAALIKPDQWVNSIIIPIVWTVIYSIASIVLFMWSERGVPNNVVALFIVNGVLNVLWCLLFFTFRLTFVGLIAIILNLIAGVLLLAEIKRHEGKYFYALSIYPIWLSIATALNAALWILN